MTHVKSNSSKWMKSDGNIIGFQWQAGYAAFSVSEKGVENVKRYVSNQKEHHEKGRLLDFKVELRALLEENDVEFDERYLWD